MGTYLRANSILILQVSRYFDSNISKKGRLAKKSQTPLCYVKAGNYFVNIKPTSNSFTSGIIPSTIALKIVSITLNCGFISSGSIIPIIGNIPLANQASHTTTSVTKYTDNVLPAI